MPNALPDFYDNLRNSLSNSAAFQTWAGGLTQPQAEARIHIQDTEEPIVRPFALLFREDGDAYGENEVAQNVFRDHGEVRIMFEGDQPAGDNPGDKYREGFTDIVGIMREVRNDSGNAARLHVKNWDLTNDPRGPARSDEGAAITYWKAFVMIEWGLDS